MGTGMQKLIVVGAVVGALAMVAPAFGKPALPEGYKLPSAQPGVWSPAAVQALGLRGEAMARFYGVSSGYTPQAVKALGERGEAMARFYGVSSGYTPQAVKALGERGEAQAGFYGLPIVSSQVANQRQLERLSALDANQRQVEPVTALDANERQVEPSQPVVSSGNGSSFDWGTVGIGAGTAALIAALGLAGILGIRGRSTVAHP
jgi:hypothetical protein